MAMDQSSPSSEVTLTAQIEERHVDIDSDGDLVFAVGTEHKSNLKVSSKVISTASTVFKAMFNLSFKEGEALSQRAPGKTCQISLPEDVPRAMEVLFRLLHFQNEALPSAADLGVAGFRDFAVACDKYDCVEAVRFAVTVWLEELLPQPHEEDEQWILLEALSFLDVPVAFYHLTKGMVLENQNSFLEKKIDQEAYTFPAIDLYIAMERQRESLRQTVLNELMNPITPLIGKDVFDTTPTVNNKVNHNRYHFSVHDTLQVSAYLRELRRLRLWPLDFKLSLKTVLDKLSGFEEREIGLFMGFKMHGRIGDCTACTYDPRNKLQDLMTKIQDAAGICLDCLLKEQMSLPKDSECRVKHTGH